VLVSDFVSAADDLWPQSLAEGWDTPGLVSGSLDAKVTKVLLAVDFTPEVLTEAIAKGANLVFTHHPALLKGATTLAESTYKGSLLAKAIRAGVAVFSAHTNADVVEDGVSAAIARALNLQGEVPLVSTGLGIGHGRIGQLEASISLGELVNRLTSVLPQTVRGVAASREASTPVRRIALCGGAGDSFISAAIEAKADVYITSDLRHHVVLEALIPLIDVSHFASESLWLSSAKTQLEKRLSGVEFFISSVNTDPWIFSNKESK
jgi:dinuclear metal center YbgI/SA1388 family protein